MLSHCYMKQTALIADRWQTWRAPSLVSRPDSRLPLVLYLSIESGGMRLPLLTLEKLVSPFSFFYFLSHTSETFQSLVSEEFYNLVANILVPERFGTVDHNQEYDNKEIIRSTLMSNFSTLGIFNILLGTTDTSKQHIIEFQRYISTSLFEANK